MTIPTTEHPETSDDVYTLYLELAHATRNQLDICEDTPDPAEARYKFDIVRSFSALLEQQIDRIPDPIERRTCQRQMEALKKEGTRIAPTIPYICQMCGHPWLPEDGPMATFCDKCDPPADNPNTPESPT